MSRRLTDAARELFRALDLDPNRHPLEVAERFLQSEGDRRAAEMRERASVFAQAFLKVSTVTSPASMQEMIRSLPLSPEPEESRTK